MRFIAAMIGSMASLPDAKASACSGEPWIVSPESSRSTGRPSARIAFTEAATRARPSPRSASASASIG